MTIFEDTASTKIYDEPDDFDFEIVNFSFSDGDVPRSTSYGVYILKESSNAYSKQFTTNACIQFFVVKQKFNIIYIMCENFKTFTLGIMQTTAYLI